MRRALLSLLFLLGWTTAEAALPSSGRILVDLVMRHQRQQVLCLQLARAGDPRLAGCIERASADLERLRVQLMPLLPDPVARSDLRDYAVATSRALAGLPRPAHMTLAAWRMSQGLVWDAVLLRQRKLAENLAVLPPF